MLLDALSLLFLSFACFNIWNWVKREMERATKINCFVRREKSLVYIDVIWSNFKSLIKKKQNWDSFLMHSLSKVFIEFDFHWKVVHEFCALKWTEIRFIRPLWKCFCRKISNSYKINIYYIMATLVQITMPIFNQWMSSNDISRCCYSFTTPILLVGYTASVYIVQGSKTCVDSRTVRRKVT